MKWTKPAVVRGTDRDAGKEDHRVAAGNAAVVGGMGNAANPLA